MPILLPAKQLQSALVAIREGLRVEKTAAYTIQIGTGRCVVTNAVGDRDVAILSSSLTKTINNSWAVGSGNGALDSGAIANAWYHVWMVWNPSTRVADVRVVLANTSTPTPPTVASGFTHYRRIWSILVQSAAIRDFDQYGALCKWRSPARDLDNYAVAIAGELRALTVPTGIQVEAIGLLSPGLSSSSSTSLSILVTDPGQNDATPTSASPILGTFDGTAGGFSASGYAFGSATEVRRITSASGQLRFRRNNTTYFDSTTQTTWQTQGYVDLALDAIAGATPSASSGIISYTLASRPSASSVPAGTQIFITDWGVAGCYLKSDGSHWASAFRQLLHRLTVPVDFSGSTASQISSSFLVPAGITHPNGIYVMTGAGGRSAGTANNVSPQMRVGGNTTGTSTLVYSNGSSSLQQFQRYLIFQNSLTQQVCPSPGNTSYGVNGSLPTDLGYNFSTTDQYLSAGGSNSSALDTFRLQYFTVEYM